MLVLVLVLVGATAVPVALSGRRVAGVPVGMDFGVPPQVGECLQSPLPLGGTGGLAVEIPITDVVLGPCTGVVGGEVVAWVPQRTTEDEEPGTSRRLRGPCFREAAQYAGLEMTGRRVVAPGAPASDLVRWSPTVGFDAHRLVPGPTEAKAGRSWYACVAVPVAHSTYTGSLRGAFVAGSPPAEFGMCWDGADLDTLARVLPCGGPHAAELLATAWVLDRSRAQRADLQRGCESIVARILRRDDPTADGKLTVVLDPASRDGAMVGNEPQSVGCFVTANPPAQLVGTLVGLADRPVPFAP